MSNPFFKNQGPIKILEILKLLKLENKNLDNFKIHDIVFLRGFYQLSQTMCQELRCQNPNGFGIVTDVNDDSLEILFGKSNDKLILFNVKKEYVKLWLRTTALSLDLISVINSLEYLGINILVYLIRIDS